MGCFDFLVKNPVSCVVGGAAGAAAVVVGAPVIVGALGFTSIGPAAGSFAAAKMSAIALAGNGGVTAGSSYALIQSAAMTGSFCSTTVLAAASATAGAATAGVRQACKKATAEPTA